MNDSVTFLIVLVLAVAPLNLWRIKVIVHLLDAHSTLSFCFQNLRQTGVQFGMGEDPPRPILRSTKALIRRNNELCGMDRHFVVHISVLILFV